MTENSLCPLEYSETNPENTPCQVCGSRIHWTNFIEIRCSFCNAKIDDTILLGDLV